MNVKHVRIYTIREGDNLDVTGFIGKDGPKIVDGFGGFTLQARRRRTSAVVWSGRNPFAMDLPIMIDNFRDNTSIEGIISDLVQMALPLGQFEPPPRVRIQGEAIPYTNLDWVIESITEGASIRNHNGNRVRYEAVVKLRSFVDVSILQKSQSGGGKGPRIYVVKKGDTLSSIAAKLLGKASRWVEIARMNGIRDPKKIKVGQKLKVPRN
jgi:LysM repeat protein